MSRAHDLAERRDHVLDSLRTQVPYVRFLHVDFTRRGDELTAVMRFEDDLVGNPLLRALHGGATGAFMEIAAIAELAAGATATPKAGATATPQVSVDATPEGAAEDMKPPPLPRTVDFTIDYLRSGRAADAYARAHVLRLGRRIAHVRVECWQDERARPIAAAHGNFLLPGA